NGAARGSQLIFAVGGEKYAADFGVAEGLAIYLSRASLPPEGCRSEATKAVIASLSQLVDPPESGHALLLGQFESSAEVMLYYYGKSTERMRAAISGLMSSHPMCAKARVVDIA